MHKLFGEWKLSVIWNGSFREIVRIEVFDKQKKNQTKKHNRNAEINFDKVDKTVATVTNIHRPLSECDLILIAFKWPACFHLDLNT